MICGILGCEQNLRLSGFEQSFYAKKRVSSQAVVTGFEDVQNSDATNGSSIFKEPCEARELY